VHGLTARICCQAEIPRSGQDFLDYVAGAELIIHNADFDVEFLDLELGRARLGPLKEHVGTITDTLFMARELHPGRRNSLECAVRATSSTTPTARCTAALPTRGLLAECTWR